MDQQTGTWIAIGVVMLAIIYLLAYRKEGYGQMKHIVKIPFNNCVNICKQYYDDCMKRDTYSDGGGWCEARFKDACTAECYYSNYQRLQ